MTNSFYRTCIREELEARIEKNSSYSLRAFAKALNLNAGALSEILAGKRHPSFKMAQKLLEVLELSPEEARRFLNSLAQAQKSRGLKRLNPEFRKQARRAGSVEPVRELSLELFKVIADWYHYAILELTYLPSFQATPGWIAKKLGISEIEAKLALERLESLGLVEEKNGSLIKTDLKLSTADRSLTTPAHKKRQKQILEKSIYSIENDPIENRNHSACTMAIDPEKIPEAKKRIQEFTRELCQFLESGNRSRVFEMQISLFPLTKEEENERR